MGLTKNNIKIYLKHMLTFYQISKFFVLYCRGADVNAKDYKGCTPLRLARRYGQDSIEAMLLEKGGKDEQDPPSRKPSVGVDPPWMSTSRKTSAISTTSTTRQERISIGAN